MRLTFWILYGVALLLLFRCTTGAEQADEAWASIQAPPGSVPLALPLNGAPATREVHPGEMLRICPATQNLAAPLRVVSILCRPGGARCVAVLAATPEQVAAFASARPENGRQWAAPTCG